MYVLSLDPEIPRALRDRLIDAMESRGAVGVLEGGDAADPPAQQVRMQGRVDTSGAWELSGDDGSVQAVLDRFAPHCRYLLLLEDEGGEWPRLEYHTGMISGSLLDAPHEPDSLDIEAVVDRVEETEGWETLESLVAAVKRSEDADLSGAIATFTGRVRAKEGPEDTPTEYLEFERYGAIADTRLEGIRRELLEREGVYDIRLHHRTGRIAAGEDIVFVVVLAGHRDEAFRTVRDGINRLKAEVPIFKKEVTIDEQFWVHDRP